MITALVVTFIVIVVFLGISYLAYDYCFKSHVYREAKAYDVPDCDFKPRALENILQLINTPFEFVNITSHDGLRLSARYYHFRDGAPVGIIMHGYRSNYCRDGGGGFRLLRDMGFNLLLPDQRAHGKSEGRVISFGINERRDCLGWTRYITERFGDKTQIILVGVSMGAATVMMASDIVPADNVKAIVADCGYTSAKEIILHVAGNMHLPAHIGYFFARVGAWIFGNLNICEHSCTESLRNTQIPLIVIHGEADGFVPCKMSRLCYESCNSYKEIFTVSQATHATSFYTNTKAYTEKVCAFLKKFVKL